MELRRLPIGAQVVCSMILASCRVKIEEYISCGRVAGGVSAEVEAEVPDVVEVEAALLDHSLHELFVSPAWGQRRVEAEGGFSLGACAIALHDRENLEHVAEEREAAVGVGGREGLPEECFLQLRRVKADPVHRGMAGADRGGVLPLDEDGVGLAVGA